MKGLKWMAKRYQNYNGVYRPVFYRQLWFYLGLALVADLSLFALKQILMILKKDTTTLTMIIYSILFIIVIVVACRAYSEFTRIKARTWNVYRDEKKLEREITKSLLSTMTVNREQNSSVSIAVPSVVVDVKATPLTVQVEKLPGMYLTDKLAEDVTASFKRSYSNYAVVSSRISDDGLSFIFELEDKATNKALRFERLEDIGKDKFIIELQKGLSINIASRPHIAVWGRTGSRKSTVLYYLTLCYFKMNADVYFCEAKTEFASFETFYDSSKIATNTESIMNVLNRVNDVLNARLEVIAEESKKRNQGGLNAQDVDFRPVVLMLDEVGSIVAMMDSKEQKEFNKILTAIIQRGRSVGVCVVIATQDPSTDTLPQKVRQQFTTKILLGSANADIQRMAFGEIATDGSVPELRGYVSIDGITREPVAYYVPDLYTYGLLGHGTFKKAYSEGKQVEYSHM